MKQFKKTKLAAIVGTAALATGLSAPANAVVVVGGDNGWEISFDGNVNAFLTFGDVEAGFPTNASPDDKNTARITSGFLPAFFSFNAKSPTVNGLTGTARISFAPTINNGGAKTQFYAPGAGNNNNVTGIQGASLDTREVVANIDGSFGQISFGRTLALFGRQAILSDMTLFGVGFAPQGGHFGSVTFGGVGTGYVYPDFSSRIQYTTPSMNGFQVAISANDPSTIDNRGGGPFGGTTSGNGFLDETDIPRFEGELSYNTTFQGGTIKLWGDGLWQEVNSTCSGTTTVSAGTLGTTTIGCGDITSWGIGGGASIGFGGFNLTGYYQTHEGLGLTAQFNQLAIGTDSSGQVTENEGDNYYVQGTYTFNGRTKVGASYGEGEVGLEVGGATTDVSLDKISVGVYHDVTSWLKVIAEYNHLNFDVDGVGDADSDTFSIGSFILW